MTTAPRAAIFGDHSFDTLPPVPVIPIPENGVINPAPNQAYFTMPLNYPNPFVHSYNLTYQRELGSGSVRGDHVARDADLDFGLDLLLAGHDGDERHLAVVIDLGEAYEHRGRELREPLVKPEVARLRRELAYEALLDPRVLGADRPEPQRRAIA